MSTSNETRSSLETSDGSIASSMSYQVPSTQRSKLDWNMPPDMFARLSQVLDEQLGELEYGEAELDETPSLENLDLASIFDTPTVPDQFELRHPPSLRCPAGRRKYTRQTTGNYVGPRGTIIEDGRDLILVVNQQKVLIGSVRRRKGVSLAVCGTAAFVRADTYSEEVHGKGSGLGFSSFCHLAASLILASDGGIIESLDGADVVRPELVGTSVVGVTTGLTIEVTVRADTRVTTCDWVVNKYALLESLCQPDEFGAFCLTASRKEERFDTTVFARYQQSRTDYTPLFERIHDALRFVTDQQIEALEAFAWEWFISMAEATMPNVSEPDIIRQIDSIITTDGGKMRGGVVMMPSSFRALPRPVCGPDETERRHGLKVDWRWHQGDAKTTYHTVPFLTDVRHHYVSPALKGYTTTVGEMEEVLGSFMEEYKIMQAILLEADLFQRITGNCGCFFSRDSQVGITWESRKGAMSKHIRFYCFTDPGDPVETGVWNYKNGVYYSPTFKMSRGELLHAIALPGKVKTAWVAIANQSRPYEWPRLAQSLALIAGVWRNSSWQTTTYASASRFKTTGHLGEMNNFNSLLRKTYIGNIKLFKSSDYLLYLLDKDASVNPPDSSVTPLFRLPLRFHCLEKDVCHGMYWHIRGDLHSVNCCKKLLDSFVAETAFRPAALAWYERQATAMESMLNNGMTYNQFKSLMDSAPDVPTLNVLLFLALASLSKESMDTVAASQTNTGFMINNMVSDRGSVTFKAGVLQSGKVAGNLAQLCADLTPSGPYNLLFQTMSMDQEPRYGISAKDAKSGDREISTMEIHQRVRQLFKESLSSTVCISMPEDAVLSKDKYGPMVKGFTEVFRCRLAASSSEDRSFFSGNMHPEALAITTACMARITGSCSLVSVAALQRLDTTRLVVLPAQMTPEHIPEGVTWTTMLRRVQGKTANCIAVRLHYHIMQGIQQINTSAVNAVFNTGLLRICEKAMGPALQKKYIITTHDDVGRAVGFAPNVDVTKATELTLLRPIKVLKHCMMVNNDKKLVISNKKGITEVNNITVVSTGMVSQAPIFGTLAVKSLTGPGPMHDLMSAVSNARNVLFWGAPPAVVWSAMLSNLHLFQQQWRVTAEQMSKLKQLGLIPRALEELISGFFPRTEAGAKAIWATIADCHRDDVINGDRPLFLSICNKTAFRNEDPEVTPVAEVSLITTKRKLASVVMARKLGGRLRPNHVRAPSLKSVIGKRDALFELLDNPAEDMPDLTHLAPPRVRVHIAPLSRRDRQPLAIGQCVDLQLPDKKKIMCRRLLNCDYRALPTESEDALIALDSDSFDTAMNHMDLRERATGFEFMSPEGLPPVGFCMGTKYARLHGFNFSVNVEMKPYELPRVHYKGVEVLSFQPCKWGGSMKHLIPAFGTGLMNGKMYALYQRQRGPMRAFEITVARGTACIGDDQVQWCRGFDYTPVVKIPKDASVTPRGNLHGDPLGLINYGNWIKTQAGFDTLRLMFDERQAVIPSWVQWHLPSYPHFPATGVRDLGDAESYIFDGHLTTCIRLGTGVMPTSYVRARTEPVTIELLPIVTEDVDNFVADEW